jgi:hypothetical protein
MVGSGRESRNLITKKGRVRVEKLNWYLECFVRAVFGEHILAESRLPWFLNWLLLV